MTRPRPRGCRARGTRHPRWLVLCALVMALLLPVQGIALSLDAALRPAHVHRHAAGCLHGAAALPSAGAVETVVDRSRIVAASSALADDTVLDYLPPRDDVHAHDADDHDAADEASGESSTDASGTAAHDDVGYHTHAPGDPDVVYVDDGRHGVDGGAAGLGKIASDGMVMLQPTWPEALPARRLHDTLPALLPAYATRHDVPPDRPPA